MARYVLLEFDRDDDANGFIANMLDENNIPRTDMTLRVLGLYMKPTQFCSCDDVDDKSARGQKYGLWIHVKCGKPKRGAFQSPTNLLRADEHIGRRKLSINLVEPQPETYDRKK